MGWCVDEMSLQDSRPARDALLSFSKWRVPPGSSSQFLPGPKEGTPGGGLVRGPHAPEVDLSFLVSAPECKASAEKNRASRAVRQEKGNLLKEKEGDWPLWRTSVLPF